MNTTEKAHAYTMALTINALTGDPHPLSLGADTNNTAPESLECAGECGRRVWEWYARFERDHTTGTYAAYCPEC